MLVPGLGFLGSIDFCSGHKVRNRLAPIGCVSSASSWEVLLASGRDFCCCSDPKTGPFPARPLGAPLAWDPRGPCRECICSASLRAEQPTTFRNVPEALACLKSQWSEEPCRPGCWRPERWETWWQGWLRQRAHENIRGHPCPSATPGLGTCVTAGCTNRHACLQYSSVVMSCEGGAENRAGWLPFPLDTRIGARAAVKRCCAGPRREHALDKSLQLFVPPCPESLNGDQSNIL